MITTTHLWITLVSMLPYLVFGWFALRQRRLENEYNAMRQDWLFPPQSLRDAAEASEKAGDAVPIAFAFCSVAGAMIFTILITIFP